MTEKVETVKTQGISPFITEEDVFDVSVDYYREGKKIITETNDGYDAKKEKSNIIFTVRYPSQSDCEIIINNSKDLYVENDEKMDIRKYMRVELIRFLTLVKKWNVETAISNETIMNLHPDIIRTVLLKVRNELGTSGIF